MLAANLSRLAGGREEARNLINSYHNASPEERHNNFGHVGFDMIEIIEQIEHAEPVIINLIKYMNS